MYLTAVFRRLGRPQLLLALLLSLGLVAAACSSGNNDDAADEETTEASLPACDFGESGPVVEPEGSSGEGELITSVSIAPGPHSVLTGVVEAEATDDVTLDVVASSDSGSVDVPTSPASTDHQVTVLGMTAETDYDVAVTATAADGTAETVDLTFSSGSLPADLPPVTTTVSEPGEMAPGVTLFNARWWGAGPDAECEPDRPDSQGWILGVDETGEVVWYYETTLEVTDVSTTPRGTLMVSIHDIIIREIDMLGNDLSELGTLVATDYVKKDLFGNVYVSDITEPTGIDSAHHELYELDNGNLLTISTEVIELDPAETEGLCDGVEDEDGNPIPDPTGVVGDVVVELTPEGEVVQEWAFSDYFDPIERQGSDLCVIGNPIAPPNWFYPDEEGLRDWTHANAAVLDEATNTLMVSSRHLDTIIGIRYADDASGPAGELLWDFSPKGGTLELTSGEFSLHGHAVEPQADGTILYYDNGNGRPGTDQGGGEAPNYSRAVRYSIDPATGTATQIWEHRDVTPEGTPQFAGFLGDADMLPNGNVLITHGGAATAAGLNYSRVVEVIPNYDGGEDTIVFDLTLGDRETLGFTAYRATRLPSLYFGEAALDPTA